MPQTYSDLQLDALRELANIGSGNAATALSSLIGRSVDISVPNAVLLPLADAVDAAGPPESEVTAVLLGISGELEALVLLLFSPQDAADVCGLLGVERNSPLASSALGEVGNILGASYVGALGTMSGLELELSPPQIVGDMVSAIVSTVLTQHAGDTDIAFMLDSELSIEGASCSLSFMLVPSPAGINELLSRLGL
jgi:chemotaxis protein CheC